MDKRRDSVGLLGLLLAVLALGGCDSGSAGKPDGGDKLVPPGLLKSAKLSGMVFDVRGNRIAGASVTIGTLSLETDASGAFDFHEIEVKEKDTLIIRREGYSTGRVPLIASESAPNHVRVSLQVAEKVRLLDPSQGGDVETDSGVVLKLKPGSVVDQGGKPVSMPVDILVALINDRDEMAAAPGDMLALDPDADEDDEPTQLESFGMVEVALSAEGKPVQMAPASQTEVLAPLSAHNPYDQGDKVGLWHFNEEEELWNAEGNAEVTASNKMKALVGHFSWWNAGQIMTETCVVGRVVDARGRPIEAAHIEGQGRSYLGSSHAMTNADGDFCLEARVNSVIKLSTLVRVGDSQAALAVNVTTPRNVASCGEPEACFVLPRELVAVADVPLCDAASCPPDPTGEKEACCISDLGPCSYVVSGDCGGAEDGAWATPADEPGVSPIPGVPMREPPSMGDGGVASMDAGMMSGGMAGRGADPNPPFDAGVQPDASQSGGGQGGGGQGGSGGSGGSGGDGGVTDPNDGGAGEAGPDGSTPVDRCGDVIPLATIEHVEGTTVDSDLLHDLYDDGYCQVFLPGYERTYSVYVGGNQVLRARVLDEGMHVMIAESCGDIDGSCVVSGTQAVYQNLATDGRIVYITVDNEGEGVQAPFLLYLSSEEPVCGDHFVDEGEDCDDGNTLDGDACPSDCMLPIG